MIDIVKGFDLQCTSLRVPILFFHRDWPDMVMYCTDGFDDAEDDEGYDDEIEADSDEETDDEIDNGVEADSDEETDDEIDNGIEADSDEESEEEVVEHDNHEYDEEIDEDTYNAIEAENFEIIEPESDEERDGYAEYIDYETLLSTEQRIRI
jgi:mannosyl-glycoprotein endo-beta-N-acetylglucosaminidase